MKKMILMIAAVSAALGLMSCRTDSLPGGDVIPGENPAADFTFKVDELSVDFTDNTPEAFSWFWEFGDGNSSTERNPRHTYAGTGTYTVTLTVNNEAGYVSEVSKRIFVAGRVKAAFTFTLTGDLLDIAEFDASMSSNAKSYEWDFGDGSEKEITDEARISHKYGESGTYQVTLKAYGYSEGDVSSVTQDVTVKIITQTTNLIQGGGMNEGDNVYWTDVQNTLGYVSTPVAFGWTEDTPALGIGGCLRFQAFPGGSGMANQLTQEVDVQEGKQYRFSALVKAPADALKCLIRFYISDSPGFMNDDALSFMALNTWGGWGSRPSDDPYADGSMLSEAVDGNMLDLCKQYGANGIGVSQEGIYTASFTGKVYISINVLTHWGVIPGDILIDEVKFEELD